MKPPINVTTLEGNNYYTDNNNQPYSGPYIEFHKNGNKSEEGSIKNGKKDGKWTHLLSDGSLVCIERFNNGVKKSEDISKDGRFYGKSIKWYENGVKKGEGTFIGDEMRKLGKWTWWYDNGNKKSEGHYDIKEKDGSVKDGLWTYYNEDGSIKETIEYNNGQEYICSECDNKKGEITKEYCLSNPLNPKYDGEPDWEDDGGWYHSKMWNCRNFCKENQIENSNDDDFLNEEYNIHNLIEQDGILTKIDSKDHVPFNGSVYQMVGGKWESKKVILGKIKDGIKVGKWTYYNKDGSVKE